MGAGPLQRGSIHDGTKFAGMTVPTLFGEDKPPDTAAPLTIADAHRFVHPAVLEQQLADVKASEEATIIPASHQQAADK